MFSLNPKICGMPYALQWRHKGLDSVSNHQPHHCLLSRLFGRRSKKTSQLRVTGLCAGNSPGTGKFPAQMASYAENVSIWWRHHGYIRLEFPLCRLCPAIMLASFISIYKYFHRFPTYPHLTSHSINEISMRNFEILEIVVLIFHIRFGYSNIFHN